MATPPSLPPRYEAIAPLGKGGVGEVWSVRDRITGRTVALKALGEEADDIEVMALVREAVALSGVEGLGVPRVLRFGRLPGTGRSYMVRELVEGSSLSDLLARGAEPSKCLGAIAYAADQVTRLHRALLLHGDIKPANIIVGEDGRATLVDLGLAAPWREGGARLEGLTPRYAAPELFQGAPLTVRSEVFALGATLKEALDVARSRLGPEVVAALFEVVARATSKEPNARYPSADELGSALRSAARLDEGPASAGPRSAPASAARDEAAGVWPIVGLDEPAGRLMAHITALRDGGGILVIGPPRSGRSALLRRIAWSLGAAGRAVAWIEAAQVEDHDEAITIELAGSIGAMPHVTVLVDDAERLGEAELARLDAVREAGGKLIFVVGGHIWGSAGEAGCAPGPAAPPCTLPGRTFEVFSMDPLDEHLASELVRRMIPSLSDAVVAYILERAARWPGRIRDIVARLARAPVVSPADVDHLLGPAPREVGLGAEGALGSTRSPDVTGLGAEGALGATRSPDVADGSGGLTLPGAPGKLAVAAPRSTPEEIHQILDRGHFEEAADALERWAGDASPEVVIARARLLTNRGDAVRALVELASIEEEVARTPDAEQAAFWSLHVARALLRSGDYGDAERRAAEVRWRLGLTLPEGAPPACPAEPRMAAEPTGERARLILAEALAMQGLAQSYAARHEEAKATLREAVRLARATSDPRSLSVALGSLAFALQRDERLAEAKAAYEEALSAAEQAGDAGTLATTRLNLAGIAKLQGDLSAAIRHLEAAVDMGRRSGRVATLRQALLNLANLDLYLGRVARARVSIDALAGQRASLAPQQHAQLLALEAEHAARSGDLAQAEALCLACAEAYEAMGRRVDAVEARLERVLFAVARPGADPRPLADALEAAAASLGATGAHRALLALGRGRVAALAGEEERARAAYDEALDAARAAGQRDWIWRALEARAQLEVASGNPLRARRDRESALMTLEEIGSKLPRDLREVFWNDARRKEVRAAVMLEITADTSTIQRSAGQAGGTSGPAAPTLPFAPSGEDRLTRVLEINRAIAGEYDLQRLLEKATDHAIALLRAERGFVILRSGGAARSGTDGSADLSIRASRDQAGDDPHARFSRSIADRVISTGEPIVTSSARDDARMSDYVSVHQLMLKAVACVPIRVRSGAVIGALYLETRLSPAHGFTEELPILVALADQVAIAIETARLVGENERRSRELERANQELLAARGKLEELLGHRTAQLAATRRDLRSARAVLRGHFGYEGLVGTSEAMRKVYALIDRVKDTDIPVLLTGESGTGKEVVARTIHTTSPRSKKPFVGINCGAIPEHLLESELFGHVRGAFTGADRDRRGLFREATEGTILLDEIGEMPPKMQAGLLRVVQEKLVRPVGGAREEPVATRVIAATHRDLADMVRRDAFREDLYYRLHVVEVRVPALRERIEDVPLLIDHFLSLFAARYARERRSVSREALKRLMAYPWPGNVRQLENVLLNAWVLSDRPELESDDFELPDAAPRSNRALPVNSRITGVAKAAADRGPAAPARAGREASSGGGTSLATPLEVHRASERERILEALESCNWNRVKAAQVVGLPRRTFYRRLKEYGIQ